VLGLLEEAAVGIEREAGRRHRQPGVPGLALRRSVVLGPHGAGAGEDDVGDRSQRVEDRTVVVAADGPGLPIGPGRRSVHRGDHVDNHPGPSRRRRARLRGDDVLDVRLDVRIADFPTGRLTLRGGGVGPANRR
jgi:hypothetical protein